MTEEQNKLAEAFRIVKRLDEYAANPHDRMVNGHLGWMPIDLCDWEILSAAIRREPATEAVLVGNVYAWLGYWRDKFPSEAVSGLQDILGPLDRALKGKGASQGVAAETYRIKSVAMGPHVTGAAPTYTGEGVSMLQVPSAAPEPSGEGIFCCLCGKNIYSGEQTKLIDFDEWEAGVRKHSFQKRIAHASCPASTDEQKG